MVKKRRFHHHTSNIDRCIRDFVKYLLQNWNKYAFIDDQSCVTLIPSNIMKQIDTCMKLTKGERIYVSTILTSILLHEYDICCIKVSRVHGKGKYICCMGKCIGEDDVEVR